MLDGLNFHFHYLRCMLDYIRFIGFQRGLVHRYHGGFQVARGMGDVAGAEIRSPRLMSISSLNVSVTDMGAKAASRSPSKVEMVLTVVRRPAGRTYTGSPGGWSRRRFVRHNRGNRRVRPDHSLHREPEMGGVRERWHVDGFKVFQQVGSMEPRCVAAWRHYVVTE